LCFSGTHVASARLVSWLQRTGTTVHVRCYVVYSIIRRTRRSVTIEDTTWLDAADVAASIGDIETRYTVPTFEVR
jgi:hypothetical protein